MSSASFPGMHESLGKKAIVSSDSWNGANWIRDIDTRVCYGSGTCIDTSLGNLLRTCKALLTPLITEF